MSRRCARGVGLAWIAACLACSAPPPPNVLLVTVDTLRADHVGAYGSGWVHTPALDRLAAEGAVVEYAFTPTPSTGPAHASLFTGLHPWNHHVLENAVPLEQGFATLAETVRRRGFATAAFVSSYVLDPRFGFDRGFDHYEFSPTHGLVWREEYRDEFFAPGEETTARAEAWIEEHEREGGGPFFLWVHYFDPHYPYDPPPAYRVPDDDPVDLSDKGLPRQVPSFEVLEQFIRRYRGEVRYADAQIDRLVLKLSVLRLLEQTAVIVTADHGEGLGDHSHLGHGRNLHDELVRVPLLIRAPGVPAGRRLAGPVQLEDLYPTIAALIGASPPEQIDGVDLLPWLRGEVERPPREAVVGRRKIYDGERAIFFGWRDERKWIGRLGAPGRVYSATGDPRELAGTKGEGAPPWLSGQVPEAARGEGAESRPAFDADVRRGLEALGYIE